MILSLVLYIYKGRKFKILFSRNSWPKSIKLGANYPWVKGIQVRSNKGPGPLQKGDNHKNVKMGWGNLKIFSRTTSGPILTRLGTKHPWRERIQVFFKEGDRLSPRGDNSERIKIHRKFLKIVSRTSRPKSIKLGTNYHLVKKIQVCSNKGPDSLQRGIITEM
jgi:hypothetical protein